MTIITSNEWRAEFERLSSVTSTRPEGLTRAEVAAELRTTLYRAGLFLQEAKRRGRLIVSFRLDERIDGRKNSVAVYRLTPAAPPAPAPAPTLKRYKGRRA